jgi:hypothetical protein
VTDNPDVAMLLDESWVADQEGRAPCEAADCLPILTQESPGGGERTSSSITNYESIGPSVAYRLRGVFTGHGGPRTYSLERSERVGRRLLGLRDIATFRGGTPDLFFVERPSSESTLVVHGNRAESPIPFSYLLIGDSGETLASGRLTGRDAMLSLGGGRTMVLWPDGRPVVAQATVRGREVSWSYRAAVDGAAVAAVYEQDHALVFSYSADRTQVALYDYD